jgi:hypothetical protein
MTRHETDLQLLGDAITRSFLSVLLNVRPESLNLLTSDDQDGEGLLVRFLEKVEGTSFGELLVGLMAPSEPFTIDDLVNVRDITQNLCFSEEEFDAWGVCTASCASSSAELPEA